MGEEEMKIVPLKPDSTKGIPLSEGGGVVQVKPGSSTLLQEIIRPPLKTPNDPK